MMTPPCLTAGTGLSPESLIFTSPNIPCHYDQIAQSLSLLTIKLQNKSLKKASDLSTCTGANFHHA